MVAGVGRGQVSMEYLLIAGFAMLLLVPIILVAYTQSASFSSDVSRAQVQKVASQIVAAADGVYYAGPPTRRTLALHFPEHIESVTLQNASIVFTMQGTGGTYEYAAYTAGNLTGDVRTFAGTHVIVVEAILGGVNITDG